MPHILIAGVTGSGKTTLAKSICQNMRKKGVKTMVLDPVQDRGWNADYQTADKAEFLRVAKQSEGCTLIVDESGQMVGKFDEEMFWCATSSRHRGHRAIFIVQRAQQISPTVRSQCDEMFLFLVSKGDAKIFAEEFARPELEECSRLGRFSFFHVGRFRPPKLCRLRKS